MRPFTDDRHERLRAKIEALARALPPRAAPGDAARFLADGGALKLCVPSAYGGVDDEVSPLALVVAREALAGVAADGDAALAVQTLAALPLAWVGTKDQRDRWLPALASGRERGAFALTERASGSDVAALETTATRDDGGYQLDGEKVLVSGAVAATVLVVFARTGAAGDKRGVTAFVVPKATPGLSLADDAQPRRPRARGRAARGRARPGVGAARRRG